MSRKSRKWGWEFYDLWCQEEWGRLKENPIEYKPCCMWARKRRNIRHGKTCLNHPNNEQQEARK